VRAFSLLREIGSKELESTGNISLPIA